MQERTAGGASAARAVRGHGLTTLGLSVDENATNWKDTAKRLDLPWPQGRLDKARDAGISAVPTYWLLDPAGKIVAKGYDLDELAKVLAGKYQVIRIGS